MAKLHTAKKRVRSESNVDECIQLELRSLTPEERLRIAKRINTTLAIGSTQLTERADLKYRVNKKKKGKNNSLLTKAKEMAFS